jgi:lipid A 3-O-deacylase
LIYIFLIFFSSLTALAFEKKGQSFNFYVENDSRNIGGPGSDNAYSSGLKISFTDADNVIPTYGEFLINQISVIKQYSEKYKTNFGYFIGQQIYTPNDIRKSEIIIDDRPYASWLHAGVSAQFQGEESSHSFDLSFGIIGPEAYGEQIQNGFHKIIRIYGASGWKNQLKTEAAVSASYQQKIKFYEMHNQKKQIFFDVIPYFGGVLGNVHINSYLGGLFRLGSNLPSDYGPARASLSDGDSFIDPEKIISEFSFYGFAAARAIVVARNIFLDGNSFNDSHRVKKRNIVYESELGFFTSYKSASLTWRFVTLSPEFYERSVINSYASLTLSYLQ